MALCTLAEAKSQLRLNTVDANRDTLLQAYIDAVTGPVETWCGAVQAATVTDERHYPEGSKLFLRSERVSAVTSVTEYQGAVAQLYTAISNPATASSYTYIREGAILTRLGSGGSPSCWGSPVYVTYTAGFLTVPADINLAARLIVQEWWETQRGSVPLPLQGGQDVDTLDGFQAFSLGRVQELLGHRRHGPFV